MTVLSCHRVEKGHIGPSDNWITHSCEEGHYCDLEGKTFKAYRKKLAKNCLLSFQRDTVKVWRRSSRMTLPALYSSWSCGGSRLQSVMPWQRCINSFSFKVIGNDQKWTDVMMAHVCEAFCMKGRSCNLQLGSGCFLPHKWRAGQGVQLLQVAPKPYVTFSMIFIAAMAHQRLVIKVKMKTPRMAEGKGKKPSKPSIPEIICIYKQRVNNLGDLLMLKANAFDPKVTEPWQPLKSLNWNSSYLSGICTMYIH